MKTALIHQLLLHFQQLKPRLRVERALGVVGNSNNVEGIIAWLKVAVIQVLLFVALAVLPMMQEKQAHSRSEQIGHVVVL